MMKLCQNKEIEISREGTRAEKVISGKLKVKD